MKKNKIIIITDLVVATLFLTTIIFQNNIEDFMIKKDFKIIFLKKILTTNH